MSQSNIAEEIKDAYPSYFELLVVAASRATRQINLGPTGIEYHFVDGSRLRVMLMRTEAIAPEVPQFPDGYRPSPNEIGRFNPGVNGHMVAARGGRWMPTLDVEPLLDELQTLRADQKDVQRLVKALTKIAVEINPDNCSSVQLAVRDALKQYAGEPMREASRG